MIYEEGEKGGLGSLTDIVDFFLGEVEEEEEGSHCYFHRTKRGNGAKTPLLFLFFVFRLYSPSPPCCPPFCPPSAPLLPFCLLCSPSSA